MEKPIHTPPTIILDGTAFIFDIKEGELRQDDNPRNAIAFDHFHYSDDGKKILLCYDRANKNAAELGEKVTKIPDGAIWLEFDYAPKIDPVGAELYWGVPQEGGYPVKEKHYSRQLPNRQQPRLGQGENKHRISRKS